MADRMMRAGFVVGLSCVATVALAQPANLPDPTRPPMSAQSDAAQNFGEASAGPVLQSVIVPKKGKPSALISGQVVKLGGVFGESRLIAISETGAVLEGPAGIERLSLTPSVEKTNVLVKKTAPKSVQSKGKP